MKYMKNKVLCVLVFVSYISCVSTSHKKLLKDTDVLKVFKKEEISSLSLIVDFFDSFVLQKVKNQNINKAYHEYFDSISNSESLEDLKTGIEWTTSNDLESLIKKLKEKNHFDEIWTVTYNIDFRKKDTLSSSLELNMEGKYIKLLTLLAKKDTIIEQYINSLMTAGIISPSLIEAMLNDFYKSYDFNNELYRLIWAVHYITITSLNKNINNDF